MATIDNLTLEIQADSSKAVKSLTDIANAMGVLKKNIPTGDKLTKLAGGLGDLSKSLSKISVSSDSLKQIANIGKNVQKLNAVNGGNLEKTAKGMKDLSESINKISVAKTTGKKIEVVSNLIKALSNFKGGKANNLVESAEGVKSLAENIDKISDEAIARIEKLGKALKKIPQYNAIKSAMDAIKKSEEKPKEEKKAKDSSTKEEGGGTAIGEIGKEAEKAETKVQKLWNTLKFVTDTAKTAKSNPLGLMALSENENALKGISETIGVATGEIATFSKVMGTAGIVITAVTTTINVLSKAFSFIIAPVKKFVGNIVSGIQQLINKLKKFPQAFLRIAFYRTIRSAIKAVSQAIKEGTQNLALYSKAMEEMDSNKANNVMSRYASEFLYLKNAIATAVMPILRALVPVIETVINKLVDLINVIAQVGSAFLGNTDFTKAKYFWVDYADSLDNATGSAKKLHHQLAGFDELNNLTDNSGSGSGKLEDASQMFEEATISAKLKAFGDKLRGFFDGLKTKMREVYDFFKPYIDKIRELATEIKERVQPNLKKIWETMQKLYTKIIKPFITGFAKGFFDVMLGDTYDTLPEAIGAIADKFGNLAEQIGFVLDKVDDKAWERFGTTLGTWFGWFVKLNAPISKTLSILSLFKPAFEEIDKIATLTFETIGYVITRTVITIKQSVENYVSQIKNSFNFGSAITEGFRSAKETVLGIVNTLIEGVKRYFSGLKNSSALANVFDGMITAVINLCTWLQDAINKINSIKSTSISVPSSITTIASASSSLVASAQAIVESTKKSNSAYTGQVRLNTTGHARADGGFVPKGDLFVANEQGAEMIGSVNNRTAVANNQMITEAIATATYNAMSRALSENNGNVTITVEGDGEKMFRVFQKKQREYQRATGLVF